MIIFLALAAAAGAQELKFPISPNPVGSGARAAGMADAFVAVADDATAASWNPAGLVQLERPEISIVGSFNAIFENFDAVNHPEFISTQSDDNFDINFMSLAYPLPYLVAGKTVTISVSFQQKFDLSRRFNIDFADSNEPFPGVVAASVQNVKFEQDGGLSAITPALAFELTHRLSLGLAVNFWRDNPFGDSGWKQQIVRRTVSTLDGDPFGQSNSMVTEEYDNFRGENVSVGLLWSLNEKWNLGLRYDSTLTASADYSRVEINSDFDIDDVHEKRTVKIPGAWSFGVAYRPNDRLTLAMDITRRRWDDFYFKDASGERFSLVNGSSLDDPEDAPTFDPTTTIRFGAEYVFIPKRPKESLSRLWSARGGLFYDEEPASGRSTIDTSDLGDGAPDKFYGITVGVGFNLLQGINIDAAYQLRYGPGTNSDFIQGVPGFEEDVFQHRVLLSAVIYF